MSGENGIEIVPSVRIFPFRLRTRFEGFYYAVQLYDTGAIQVVIQPGSRWTNLTFLPRFAITERVSRLNRMGEL